MAGKQPGCKQRGKDRRRKARIEPRVADQRADFHHQAVRQLVGVCDRIGVEDLKIKNLSRKGRGRRKRGLNRSIATAGWGQFRRILAWHATKAGKTVVVLPAGDTSQGCSCCRAKAKPRIELSDRVFSCRYCGLSSDATATRPGT